MPTEKKERKETNHKENTRNKNKTNKRGKLNQLLSNDAGAERVVIALSILLSSTFSADCRCDVAIALIREI